MSNRDTHPLPGLFWKARADHQSTSRPGYWLLRESQVALPASLWVWMDIPALVLLGLKHRDDSLHALCLAWCSESIKYLIVVTAYFSADWKIWLPITSITQSEFPRLLNEDKNACVLDNGRIGKKIPAVPVK